MGFGAAQTRRCRCSERPLLPICSQATNAVWIPWNMLFIAWYEHSKRLAASVMDGSATGAGDHRSHASSAGSGTSSSSGGGSGGSSSSSGGGNSRSGSRSSNRGGGGSERGSGGGAGDNLEPNPLEGQPAALQTGATAQRPNLDTRPSSTGRGRELNDSPQVDDLPPWVLAVCSAGGTQGDAVDGLGISLAWLHLILR